MTIGDRVRLLHSNEEGVISKVVSSTLVEIEIEEGFHIPVKISELVLIAKEEQIQFGGQDSFVSFEPAKPKPEKPKVLAQFGIFTAFTSINDRKYVMHLINNTDYDLLFTFGIESNQIYEGVITHKITSKNSLKIYDVDIRDFEKWGVFVFQFLFFKRGIFPLREPLVKRVRYRANSFFKSQQKAPILAKDAYLLQLDKDEKIAPQKSESSDVTKENTSSIDPQKIKEEMFSSKTPEVKSDQVPIAPPKLEVDLHIEVISSDYQKLNSSEIIQLQIKTFEDNLEAAIACGMSEIIFIHGVGNGKLRNEIHRRLSGNPVIKFYQDAQKEKFGYGATLVKFN